MDIYAACSLAVVLKLWLLGLQLDCELGVEEVLTEAGEAPERG